MTTLISWPRPLITLIIGLDWLKRSLPPGRLSTEWCWPVRLDGSVDILFSIHHRYSLKGYTLLWWGSSEGLNDEKCGYPRGEQQGCVASKFTSASGLCIIPLSQTLYVLPQWTEICKMFSRNWGYKFPSCYLTIYLSYTACRQFTQRLEVLCF